MPFFYRLPLLYICLYLNLGLSFLKNSHFHTFVVMYYSFESEIAVSTTGAGNTNIFLLLAYLQKWPSVLKWSLNKFNNILRPFNATYVAII